MNLCPNFMELQLIVDINKQLLYSNISMAEYLPEKMSRTGSKQESHRCRATRVSQRQTNLGSDFCQQLVSVICEHVHY